MSLCTCNRQEPHEWNEYSCMVTPPGMPLEEFLRRFPIGGIHSCNQGVIDRLVESNKRLLEALESIAKNTCCDKCQEASLVAQAAIREARDGEGV